MFWVKCRAIEVRGLFVAVIASFGLLNKCKKI